MAKPKLKRREDPRLQKSLDKFESEAGASNPEEAERIAALLGIYRRLHKANRHKMEPIPVCLIPEHLKGNGI